MNWHLLDLIVIAPRLHQLLIRKQVKDCQLRVHLGPKNRPVFESRRFRTLLHFLHWVLWHQTENAKQASTRHSITILMTTANIVQVEPKYRFFFFKHLNTFVFVLKWKIKTVDIAVLIFHLSRIVSGIKTKPYKKIFGSFSIIFKARSIFWGGLVIGSI